MDNQPQLEKMIFSRQASDQIICFCVHNGTISLQIQTFPSKELPKFPIFSHCANSILKESHDRWKLSHIMDTSRKPYTRPKLIYNQKLQRINKIRNFFSLIENPNHYHFNPNSNPNTNLIPNPNPNLNSNPKPTCNP